MRRVPAALELACPDCRRPHDERALVCALCGRVLRRELPRSTPRASEDSEDSSAAPHAAPSREDRRARVEPWVYLGLGLATAPLFAWAPLLSYMAWFLAALPHEMGHAAAAWLSGMPAIPAISPGGDAAAVHGERSTLVALTLALVLAALIWHRSGGRTRRVALALLAGVETLLAFPGSRELAHLLAGHSAELAFATLCLWKTLDGGFTDSRLERWLYGTLGWRLLGTNLALCWGLMQSAAARGAYRSNGSFGLTNDYLRVADLLSVNLQTVALGMLVVGLLAFPAALGLWRLSSRVRGSDAAQA